MTTISIGDLPREEALDREARLAMRGGINKQSSTSLLSSDSYDPGDRYQPPWRLTHYNTSPSPAGYWQEGHAPFNQYHYKAGDPYSSATPTSPAFLTV